MGEDERRMAKRKAWLIEKVPELYPWAGVARPFEEGRDQYAWILRFRFGKEELQAKFPLPMLKDVDTESQLEDILRRAQVVPYPPRRK
jgi:hypothetical protein